MSNNLGSIYATTVNGTKRIIINSDSVDISANFFINGTNSRMPAEFENSIRNVYCIQTISQIGRCVFKAAITHISHFTLFLFGMHFQLRVCSP